MLEDRLIQFNSQSKHYFCHTTPILKLDQKGEVSTIYFSHKNCKPNLTFDQVESFYQAYQTFFKYLKSPDYQYCFRLKAGDCLLVENFRILHGRAAYDAKSAPRHLEVGFLDWEYFMGRQKFEQLKHLYI